MTVPICACHGMAMSFCPDRRYRAGGFWRCLTKKRDQARRRYAEDPEIRLKQQLRNLSRIRVVN